MPASDQPSLVSLRVGTLRGRLSLYRTPKYLRFVMAGADWDTLDALDQLDDTPREGEQVMAAALGKRGSVHVCRRGKGQKSSWHRTATYHLLPEQPSQEVLRNTAQWQAWCLAQEVKVNDAKA